MSRKRILLADDNDASRELIREVLEGSGYIVIEAADGRETLRKVNENPPDLLLLDIQMPHVDGYGVLNALRGDLRFAELPVVALTAFAMHGDRERALGAGFDGYVTKPVDIAALRVELQRFL
jgi:CheY-like chemotaxis protein